MAREGIGVGVSMVGRILRLRKRTGQLVEPLRRISARRRVGERPRAVRTPHDDRSTAPGGLIQIDTLDIRPEPGVVGKRCTARDVVSRWDRLPPAGRATATAARAALAAVLRRQETGSTTVRSHQALAYQIPAESLAPWPTTHPQNGTALY